LINCVVDASVGIKLFLDEPLSENAHALFSLRTRGPLTQFHVPDLFYIECTNILWKYVRRFGLEKSNAQSYIQDLSGLALTTTTTELLIDAALDIALDHTISAYDASYVALAWQLDLPFVTADERLVHSVARSMHDVRWLGDIPATSPPTSLPK
jgi:predicted nucleic acid-binding protein